jgi:hypothetical protein
MDAVTIDPSRIAHPARLNPKLASFLACFNLLDEKHPRPSTTQHSPRPHRLTTPSSNHNFTSTWSVPRSPTTPPAIYPRAASAEVAMQHAMELSASRARTREGSRPGSLNSSLSPRAGSLDPQTPLPGSQTSRPDSRPASQNHRPLSRHQENGNGPRRPQTQRRRAKGAGDLARAPLTARRGPPGFNFSGSDSVGGSIASNPWPRGNPYADDPGRYVLLIILLCFSFARSACKPCPLDSKTLY